MALTSDIFATWVGPGQVVRRRMAVAHRESRALVLVLLAGILLFVARAPVEARLAYLTPEGTPLAARLYWSALFFVFLLPLLLYGLAALGHLLARMTGAGQGGWFGGRIALFWAVLALTPLSLVIGLVAALAGPGVAVQALMGLWLAVLIWFWIAGLRASAKGVEPS